MQTGAPKVARAPARRELLELAGLGAALAWLPGLAAASLAGCRAGHGAGAEELQVDVLVVGGGLGGCAAALAACRGGARVLLAEESTWLGGQLTSQAVPPDEHRAIETHGSSRSWRELRTRVREHYRARWPLSERARAREALNPGEGWVSRLCCEPDAALAALDAMLAPHVAEGRLDVWLGSRPLRAEVERDHVRRVVLQTPGGERAVRARTFVDACEDGSLSSLCGAEHRTGSEARAETGEPHAAERARPLNVQAGTWVMALAHEAGADHRTAAPEGYARWRAFVPELDPPWPGRLLDWTTTHPRTAEPRRLEFSPLPADEPALRPNLWTYRRVRCSTNLDERAVPRDATLVNWPQNDYLLGDVWSLDPLERERHRAGARELSLCLLHWLRSEAPRSDGGAGWPGLVLAPSVAGTPDGLAARPYQRESLRLVTETTLREQDIEPSARAEELGVAPEDAGARPFADAVGVGHYGEIDLHPTIDGDNYRSLGCLPFQLPLGMLIPVRLENLLPAAKNVGSTHITNGVCRLHPVEWVLGEVAGTLAAAALRRGLPARAVRARPAELAQLQRELGAAGVDLAWP